MIIKAETKRPLICNIPLLIKRENCRLAAIRRMRGRKNDKTNDGDVCKSSRTTREILTTTGQDKPQTVVEGELTSRRVFCRGRPQADWELRKPNVRSSRAVRSLLSACHSNLTRLRQQSRVKQPGTAFSDPAVPLSPRTL